MGRLKLFLPILLFIPLAVLLYFSLGRDTDYIPSALINKPVPDFELPRLDNPEEMVDAQVFQGQVSLLNVWASWCFACRLEHAQLNRIATEFNVPVIGLNYKDEADAAQAWLQRFGDPYRFSIQDRAGSLALDLGVYGAPETFLVDARGTIRHKHVGIVDERVWSSELLPRINALNND